MNVDELQSVRNRERQTDSLQQLSDTFYRDAGEFIRELKRERARVAEAADDPFDSTDVRRLTDEIKTAESTVESIYERRVGKIVKQASLEAAGMPADADGLTAEELDLFETLVAAIENNRERVLDGVLAGGAGLDCTGTGDSDPVEDTEPAAREGSGANPEPGSGPDPRVGTESEPVRSRSEEGVSAAEAMGAGPSEGSQEAATDAARDPSPEPPSERNADTDPAPASEPEPEREPEPEPEPAASYPEPGTGGEPGDGDIDRATVRITDDVGEIYGVDDRAYELSAEDVVTLPTVNAGPLVEQGAAERLD